MKQFLQHPVFTRAGVLLFLYGLCLSPVWAQMPAAPFQATADENRNTIAAAELEAEQNNPDADATDKAAQAKLQPGNRYLTTFLALQRQNVLLTKLLERERSIMDMVANYKRIGIEYEPPKPDLKTCQEIPLNLACAVAYPDRYGSFLPPPAPLPAVPIMPVAVSTDELPQAVELLSPDAGIKDLVWTDITCLNDNCRAVITPDPSDSSARYSVKVGDALPPGGVVQSISYLGVVILHGRETITLEPAPTRPFSMLRGSSR